MVIVCTYKTCGVRVIVSNNYQNDHSQLVNAVLGVPHYEKQLKYEKSEEQKEQRKLDDLVDKLNDCDMEEAPPSADDIFAYEFFKKADLLRNARIYSGNGTDGKSGLQWLLQIKQPEIFRNYGQIRQLLPHFSEINPFLAHLSSDFCQRIKQKLPYLLKIRRKMGQKRVNFAKLSQKLP